MALTKAPEELLDKSFTTGLSISTADNTDTLTLTSTDADDNSGPNLNMYRNSASAADADVLGQVKFTGKNDAGSPEDIVYGSISGKITDASDGTEDGNLRFFTMAAGTSTETLTLSSGKVGIGTTAPVQDLHIHKASSSSQSRIQLTTSESGATANDGYAIAMETDGRAYHWLYENANMVFATNNTERMRIDSSGRVLIGLGTADTLYGGVVPALQVEGTGAHDSAIGIFRNSNDGSGPTLSMGKSRGTADNSDTIVQSGDYTGTIAFTGADGGERMRATAAIKSSVDGTPGDNDMPGRLTFWTTPDGGYDEVERMRITSDGRVGIATASPSNYSAQFVVYEDQSGAFNSYFLNDNSSGYGLGIRSDSGNQVFFYIGGTHQGTISSSGGTTAYGTSSDYRLKENVVDLSNGITRLKELKPKQFNFIADETNTVRDGFLAHEAQEVVPEAVAGEKDAEINDKGIGYQQMDYGKITPLLTAALQEAIAKIETLEAKVKALEEA